MAYYQRGNRERRGGRGRGRGRGFNRGRGKGRGRGRGRPGGYNQRYNAPKTSDAAWNMLDSYPGKFGFSFIKLNDDQLLTVPLNNFGEESDASYIYDCKVNKWKESTLKQCVQSPTAICIDRESNHLYIYGRNKVQQTRDEFTPYGLYRVGITDNKMELLTDKNLQETIGTDITLFFIDNKLHLFTNETNANSNGYKYIPDNQYQPHHAPPTQGNCHLIWNSDMKQFDVVHKFGKILKPRYSATLIQAKKMVLFFSEPDIYELDLETNKIRKLELKMPRLTQQRGYGGRGGRGRGRYEQSAAYTGSSCSHIAALSGNEQFVVVYDDTFASDDIWVYNVEKRVFWKSAIKRTANGYPVIVHNELHLIVVPYHIWKTHEFAQAYHEKHVASVALKPIQEKWAKSRAKYEVDKAERERIWTERQKEYSESVKEYTESAGYNVYKSAPVYESAEYKTYMETCQKYNQHRQEYNQNLPEQFRRTEFAKFHRAKPIHTNHLSTMDGIIRAYENMATSLSDNACNHYAMDINHIIPGYLLRKKKRKKPEIDTQRTQSLEEQNQRQQIMIRDLRQELKLKDRTIQRLQIEIDRLKKQKVLNPKDYVHWKYNEIVDWIISLNTSKFAKYRDKLMGTLKNEEIDGSCLSELTVNDLHRFGVDAFKDKQRIIKEIQKLVKDQKYAAQPENDVSYVANEGQSTNYM
eukprot:727195_1